MGIDRIGKGGGAPPASAPQGAGGAERARGAEGARFEVRPEAVADVSKTAPVAAVAPTPLDQLRAGQIDLETYLDRKVDAATAHLEGLAPGELDALRTTLRDQLATDPALVDLVRHATGSTPTRRED